MSVYGEVKNRRRYDEYYTRYEQVKDIFENYIPNEEIKDKIIYCPCDSDESNFVIYLKEHKADLQYKELIYTWDDYNTHLDLFEKCDIIITNPPFSKLIKEFIPILNKVNKKFFILGSLSALPGYHTNFKIDVHYQFPPIRYSFICPENRPSPIFAYIYNIDNIKLMYNVKTISKTPKNSIKAYDEDGNEYAAFDKLTYVPNNFKEEFLCPLTILFEHNRQYVEYIKPAPHRLSFEDGKPRYVRYLTKLKEKD